MKLKAQAINIKSVDWDIRATCTECGKRRMCNVYHIQFATWIDEHPYRRTLGMINLGYLCTECAAKLRKEVL